MVLEVDNGEVRFQMVNHKDSHFRINLKVYRRSK